VGKLAHAFDTMAVQIRNKQQELEKKVRDRTAQLESVNKELEAFSYSVSHDLRAPLRAIMGYSTMLKEDYAPKLDADAERMFSAIVSNARMMGQLIDDLIAFSRMERKELAHQPVAMDTIAETCLQELLPNGQGAKYKVQLNSLPGCFGDQSMIKQVWINLISNAIKYSSKESAPRIEIGYEEQEAMNVYFVRDNGVGFDMQYANKLFGVFQRLHRQEEFEGTGVGLALVKRIVDKHNGKIWAASTPGEGAVFYFSLPKTGTYE
jgi:light-regulated signal transduction histidine kinase (bacteriophytochrome)